MKAYSLVSVLMATVLLLAGLVPMLHIQGRLYEQARQAHVDELVQILERDFQTVQAMTFPQNKAWQSPPYALERKVKRVAPRRFQVTYLITKPNRSGFSKTITREWCVE